MSSYSSFHGITILVSIFSAVPVPPNIVAFLISGCLPFMIQSANSLSDHCTLFYTKSELHYC